MEVLTDKEVDKMLNETEFVKLIERLKYRITSFCKKNSINWPDKADTWEDLFQTFVFNGVWLQYKQDINSCTKRDDWEYFTRGKWAVQDLRDRLLASKRNPKDVVER